MIDAGTISASLVLDTGPFSTGIDEAIGTIYMLGWMSGEKGEDVKSLGDILAQCGAKVSTEFDSPIRNAAATVGTACSGILSAVSGLAAQIAVPAVNIKNSILLSLKGTAPEGRKIMMDFGQGLINGLAVKQPVILAKARSMANSVVRTMKKALGIASPSRVMREVGQFTAEGMALGLQDMGNMVERASRALADNAVTGADMTVKRSFDQQEIPVGESGWRAEERKTEMSEAVLSRKLDTLIDLLSNSRQSIEIDRRTFGTLVREYS